MWEKRPLVQLTSPLCDTQDKGFLSSGTFQASSGLASSHEAVRSLWSHHPSLSCYRSASDRRRVAAQMPVCERVLGC